MDKNYYCNAIGYFGKEIIECGLIAKYIFGKQKKIFRCELHYSNIANLKK